MAQHIVQGIITLTSQTHISSPIEDLRLDRDGSTLHRTLAGRSVVRTVTRPVYVLGQFRGEIPVLPASTLKGAMRHLCTKSWLSALGIPITEALAHAMLTGAALSSGVASEQYRQTLIEAAQHPFVGLFGGGPNRLPGRMTICDAMPITVATLDANMVPARYAELAMIKNTQKGTKPIEPWDIIEYDHTNRTGSLDEADLQLDAPSGKRMDALYSWQVMPAGTPLFMRMELPEMPADDLRLALALEALRQFGQRGIIGGRTHAGFGRFDMGQFEWAQVDVAKRDVHSVESIFAPRLAHDQLAPSLEFKKKGLALKNAATLAAHLTSMPERARDELDQLIKLYGGRDHIKKTKVAADD